MSDGATKFSLRPGQLSANRPVRWSLFDPRGGLLLGEGSRVSSRKQIDRLIEMGAWYYDIPRITVYRPTEISVTRKMSSFDIVTTLLSRLELCFRLLHSSSQTEQFARSITLLAIDIQSACATHPSAVLGSIQVIADAPVHVSHALHSAVICEMAARSMGMDLVERIPLLAAALTQNIGMIEIQQELNEQNQSLSQEQRALVDMHPQVSADMLAERGVTDTRWLNAVAQHHERINGSGYPRGLKAEAITRDARLLGITDHYVAMTRSRLYRPPLKTRAALKAIYQGRGESVDTDLMKLFVRVMGLFPPGSLVRLKSNEIAIVLGHVDTIDQPQIALLTDVDSERLERPVLNVSIHKSEILGTLSIFDHLDLIDHMGEIWPRIEMV